MKKLLTIMLIFLISSTVFAELRMIAISCNAVIKKETNGSTIIKGFKYSLYTGLKEEEVKNVTLDQLIPKLEKVKWSGSVMYVYVYTDYNIGTKKLIKLIKGIEKNPNMELVYYGNGKPNKSAEHIRKNYKF